MTARVSILLKSRASLTCFRGYFLPGRAKDFSAPWYYTFLEIFQYGDEWYTGRTVGPLFLISVQHKTERKHITIGPISVAAPSKACVCGRSLAGIAGSNPTGGHGCLSLVSVVCCQVEVSASDSSRGVLPSVV